MSKFNRAETIEEQLAKHPDATTNHGGGLAFRVSPEMELYLRACTALIEDKFYTRADSELAELRALIRNCDRKYVLQLAHFVRNKMHLRSFPMVLLAEAASMEAEKGEPKRDVREYVPKIVRRADEPAELLAYWIDTIGGGTKKNLPNALKKGLSDALLQFDEYQLAKYDRKGKIKLKDVIQLVHPVPDTPERSELYRRALDGELKTPDTWEVNVSTKGSTAEVWNESAKSMGIMALLRNLRNFEEKGAEEAIRIAIERFTDAEAVRKSKLLPFRWYQAYKHVKRNDLRDALHEALDLSLGVIEAWPGRTAIFSDNSGSMYYGSLSKGGSITRIEVAALMSAMALALSAGEYYVGAFADHFAWVDLSRHDSVLTNMQRIRDTEVGCATNAYKSIRALREQRVFVDRVLIFSDMQCYDTQSFYLYAENSLVAEWTKYRREVNPNARLYSIDLAGYGTSQFLEGDPSVVLLSGWSESVLSFVRHYENGETVLEEIKKNW